MTIKSPVAGDGTHGGLIAVTSNDSDVTIEGCVFNGKLLGSNTANCGGFVGYARNLLNIKNSLFAPSEVTITGDENFSRKRDVSVVTLDNAYYTSTLGNSEQGKRLIKSQNPPMS